MVLSGGGASRLGRRVHPTECIPGNLCSFTAFPEAANFSQRSADCIVFPDLLRPSITMNAPRAMVYGSKSDERITSFLARSFVAVELSSRISISLPVTSYAWVDSNFGTSLGCLSLGACLKSLEPEAIIETSTGVHSNKFTPPCNATYIPTYHGHTSFLHPSDSQWLRRLVVSANQELLSKHGGENHNGYKLSKASAKFVITMAGGRVTLPEYLGLTRCANSICTSADADPALESSIMYILLKTILFIYIVSLLPYMENDCLQVYIRSAREPERRKTVPILRARSTVEAHQTGLWGTSHHKRDKRSVKR